MSDEIFLKLYVSSLVSIGDWTELEIYLARCRSNWTHLKLYQAYLPRSRFDGTCLKLYQANWTNLKLYLARCRSDWTYLELYPARCTSVRNFLKLYLA